ncbi:MAG: TIGR02099 family protein [Betaproteobacteria bacterium]|nr:TIGR02099 family protein [Betaproteobacteria bacterium]
MIKKSLLWVYQVMLWLTAATFALFAIAALTIHFWLMPNVGQYKADIARYASQAMQQKVTIGDLKAGWHALNPYLTISNINIYDAENRPSLQLHNTDVTLSWLSIPLLEPHLSKISIHAPALTIRRDADGEIFVAGISVLGQSDPTMVNWLLRQNKLNIQHAKIIWLDEKRNAPSLSLNDVSITLSSPPWRGFLKQHSLKISATPSVASQQPILISADLRGDDVSKRDEWHGSIDVKLTDTNLAAFKPWLDYPIDLQSGTGHAEFHLELDNQLINSVDSTLTIKNLMVKAKADASPITLKELQGKLNWHYQPEKNLLGKITGGYTHKIRVEKLSLLADNGLSLNNVSVDYSHNDASKQTLSLHVGHVDLSLIQPFIAQLPLSEKLRLSITTAAPTGALDDLKVSWQAQHDVTSQYQIKTRFRQLSIQPYENIPGFTNFSGQIEGDQESGLLSLDTQNATLNLKDILRWPIPVDTLNGDVAWKTNNKVTTVDIRNLSIANPHISGTVNANYIMDGNKGGLLDLTGKFGQGNAKYALFYYPIMLGETTLHWLDTSILEGRAEDIHLTIKGRLADFPYVNSKNIPDPTLGTFKVTAKLSDIFLEYGTGWPEVEKLALDVLFEGKRMVLNAHSGHVLGNRIIKSNTVIPQLDADYPMLYINSEVTGPVAEALRFVNNSPVKEATQGLTQHFKTQGNGKLNLSLKIPMQALEAAQYKGLYKITNASLASDGIPSLSQINGALEFTESSLTAKDIKASAFGSPLTLNLSSGKDKIISVSARGRLSNDSIRQMLIDQNMPKLTQYISGTAEWVGDIVIQNSQASIGIRSNLVGLTSHLPLPLSKSAAQSFPIRIDRKLGAKGDTLFMNLNNQIHTKIARSMMNGQMTLDYANIVLGANQGSLQSTAYDAGKTTYDTGKTKGVDVSGNLDYLDGDAWRSVMQQLSGAQHPNPISLQKVALKIDALDIFNRRLNQLTILHKGIANGIEADLQSREITGHLQWISDNNGKLIGRLSNLTIPEAAPDKISTAINTETKTPPQFTKLNQDYPALDITADNFEFNKKNFGALELIANPQHDNWNIQKLKFISPEGTISAEGQWNNWEKNPSTALNVSWEIKDLGKTLQRLGYPDTIKDGEGTLSGKLYWPGSPHQFEATRLDGHLQIDVRKGQILQVKPGVGRLLGLLSLQSLPRRLTLDFRDLFNRGFAFDKINATVRIEKGVMRSDNFNMSGPAADVAIKGETHLQEETQHLFVKVLPRISDSVSLAALAGGPLAGAVAFLAQKILKDPLNKIASSEYEIIGTWDNPQEVTSKEDNKNSPPANVSPLN